MRVFYLADASSEPYGGIVTMRDHVVRLRASGREAWVVFPPGEAAPSWLDCHGIWRNDAPELSAEDVQVVSETYEFCLPNLSTGCRTVVFNQRVLPYAVGTDLRRADPYRGAPGVVGYLVVSPVARVMAEQAHPRLRVSLVSNAVDNELFRPGGLARREKIVAFYSRKRREDWTNVINLLVSGGKLAGWRLLQMNSVGQREAADVLRRASIYASFAERESFGLAAAEAMASGALVVGYTGGPAAEYFRPPYAIPVPDGDVSAYVAALEQLALATDGDPRRVREQRVLGSEFIAASYSRERQQRELSEFIDGLPTWRPPRPARLRHPYRFSQPSRRHRAAGWVLPPRIQASLSSARARRREAPLDDYAL